MKKIYSIMLAALAVCAVSCQEGPLESQTPEAPQADNNVTFTASFDEATKVALGTDGVTPYWQNDDAISIYSPNFKTNVPDKEPQCLPELFKTSLTEQSQTATFKYAGTKDLKDFVGPYYAVYAHLNDGVTNLYGTTVHNVIIPVQQVVEGENVSDRYAAAMIAKAETRELSFKNLTSLLKFTVAAEGVTSVKFIADVDIAGEGHADVDPAPKFTLYGNQSKLVELKGNFQNGKTYYVAIAPAETKSLKMYVNDVLVKSKETASLFERGKIYNMGEITPVKVQNVDITFYLQYPNWDGCGRYMTHVHLWSESGDWDNWPGFKSDEIEVIGGVEYRKWIIQRPSTDLNHNVNIIFNGNQKQSETGSFALQKVMYFGWEANDWANNNKNLKLIDAPVQPDPAN